MPAVNLPPCPPSLKNIQHYLKTAAEHDDRDVVVAYWCRLHALETGLKTDKSSAEARALLLPIMDWLEKTKAEQKDNEAVTHSIPAQAYLENYALKLFLWADSQDRAGVFNKKVVRAFYTAGMIYDVLEIFGQLTEEVLQNRKYAKWKAAYINKCLNDGQTPVPGPMVSEGDGEMGFTMPQPPQPKNDPSPDKVSPTVEEPPKEEDNKDTVPLSLPTPPEPQNPDPLSPPIDYNLPGLPPQPDIKLSPQEITKAQKYCKFAASALNYDDIATAISNLKKALHLLSTGVDE